MKRPSKSRCHQRQAEPRRNGHNQARSGYICGAAAARGTIGVGGRRALRSEVRTPEQGGRGLAAERCGVFGGVSERSIFYRDDLIRTSTSSRGCVWCVWCVLVCIGCVLCALGGMAMLFPLWPATLPPSLRDQDDNERDKENIMSFFRQAQQQGRGDSGCRWCSTL